MTANEVKAPGAADASPQVVMIVEDEFLIRLLLSEALRLEGYAVMEAASADEAFSVLLASPDTDILVTDVRMPGAADGLELAAFVRRTKPGLKVIITSGHAGADRVLGLADAFMPKPYELDAILRRIRALTADA